jgi:HAD superfamily hydrolase (TIGR01509 family)
MTAALLFDLDGTLVDTDAEHFDAFSSIFGDHGLTLDLATYRSRIMGAPTAGIAAEFLGHLSAVDALTELARKEAYYRSLLTDLRPIAGVVDLLDFADRHQIPAAVVTNAPRANAEAVLAGLGIAHRFRALVIGDELVRGKPDPLPYLTGIERLGADPRRSLAFEDSRSGVRSAVAAGLTTIGIMTALDEVALLELGARMAATDFTDPRLYKVLAENLGC